MKINIAMCTTDIQYSKKVMHYFQVHYYDKFVWNIFTEASYLVDFCKNNDVDVLLLGYEMKSEVDLHSLGKKGECILAYMVEDSLIEEIKDIYQLEKYSRADKIYRDLLELYSHKANIHFRNSAVVNDKTEVYAFVSPAGGCGTSTIASAMAQNYAKFEKVLYVNLETTGGYGLIYNNVGNAGFDEVIFAIKSRRNALELKLASSVSRADNGVFFFSESASALDVMDLTMDDIKEFLVSIQQSKEYDKVILDVGNALGTKEIAALTYANRIVAIIDDTEITKKKLQRYISTLQIIEQKNKADICSKMILFFNKILKHTQLPEQILNIRVGGGFPKIENGTYSGVIDKISGMEIISNVK